MLTVGCGFLAMPCAGGWRSCGFRAQSLALAVRRNREAFTLIEIAIAIFIMLLVLTLAVPSMQGVMADRRLRRSLDDLNQFVRLAQERSVADRRAYLISWQKDQLILRPEGLAKDESAEPTAVLRLEKGDAFVLKLPAALAEDPPADWAFWPTGTCEPAIVTFKGVDGSWIASYSPLSVRPELTDYVAK